MSVEPEKYDFIRFHAHGRGLLRREGKGRDDWIGEGALERGCVGEMGWVI